MKILCIGDSNTYGYDPRSYTGSRYPEDERWTGRLSGHEVINCGVNGLTVPRSYQSYIGRINANDPDLVTVMLGTNELCSGLSAEQITDRMGTFLDAIIDALWPYAGSLLYWSLDFYDCHDADLPLRFRILRYFRGRSDLRFFRD